MAGQPRCPKCKSTTIRSREAIYKGGTSNYSGRSKFGGLSFGLTGKARPRIFFGGSTSSGTRQSIIAQEAAPSSYGPGISLLVICFFLFGKFPLFSFLMLLFGCALLYSTFRDNENFEKEWICSKCGNKFVKNAAEAAGMQKLLEEKVEQIAKLTEEVCQDITKRVRLNKANKVLKLIEESLTIYSEIVDTVKQSEVGEAIGFEDGFRAEMATAKEQVKLIIKIVDLIELFDKADEEHVANNNKAEIRHLLEAERLIKVKKITDTDLTSLQVKSTTTNEAWTIEYMLKRLAETGYKAEGDNFVNTVREDLKRAETFREQSPETEHSKLTEENNVNEIESTHNKNGKACSICGKWYPFSEFEYGNRENRSYCKKCNSEEKAAYAQGGVEAARQYREKMREKWK